MNLVKDFLRDSLPHFVVEAHRRKFRLQMIGVKSSKYSPIELEAATASCRFELWPKELKQTPYNWTLVDVGANNGDYLAAALKLVQPTEVIAIEPLPICQPALQKVLQNVENAQLIPAVAGSSAGEITINCTSNSKMSSVLQPLDTIKGTYEEGDFTIASAPRVPVVRLDDVVSPSAKVGLLKIDVQGYEMEVLRGALRTLSQTLAIQIEINYAPHYSGSVTYAEIHDFLDAAGFRLYGVSAPYFGNNQPLWADAVYVRNEASPSPILSPHHN